MMKFRFASVALALSLITTAACGSTRGRQVAYAAGGAAIVGGGALAIAGATAEDSEGDVPFDELAVQVGVGLAIAGAVTVLATAMTEPEPEPAPAARTASLDEQLRAMAAAR